jgi:hypothetical protein
MGLLLFKKCFFDVIRAGTKSATIRRWATARVRAGQRVFAPGLGYLDVLDVQTVELSDLDDTDALADGFANAGEMRSALAQFYPHVETDGKRWFRVRFKWVSFEPSA